MTTMNAVRIHGYGGPEVLTYESAPVPKVGDNEVLVRLSATSVNPFDAAMRAGYIAQYIPRSFPAILGTDIAGRVDAIGPAVTSFAVGDMVYGRGGIFRDGSYAEYAVVGDSELAMLPTTIDAEAAAALPHVALSAWQAMFSLGELSEGQTILIHGAAGGVGHVATQLAKWRGATVIGTTSRYADFLRGLGADEVVDYPNTPFEDVAREVDIVLDTVGGDTQDRSWQTLKSGGILVSLLQPPSPEAAAEHGVRFGFVDSAPPVGATLTEVGALVDGGVLKPEISATFALAEARKAHELIEQRHTRGKIILQVP